MTVRALPRSYRVCSLAPSVGQWHVYQNWTGGRAFDIFSIGTLYKSFHRPNPDFFMMSSTRCLTPALYTIYSIPDCIYGCRTAHISYEQHTVFTSSGLPGGSLQLRPHPLHYPLPPSPYRSAHSLLLQRSPSPCRSHWLSAFR